ncbi:MAG TPA: STAS domain-containing protein [Nitrospirota bacterium]|nr:STAS domain-containing protein [Nitrospirota bacterium]
MAKFSVLTRSELDVAVITPRGYLTDMGAHEIELASEQFLDNGYRKLIINFASVELVNTIGISVLMGVLQRTSECGCRVCFTDMNRLHREIFELTGLTKHVDIFQDENAAMSFLTRKV